MLYSLATRLLINVLAILLIAHIVPGISVDTFITALVVALVLGIINLTLKPLLLLLTFPLTVLTLGLFVFVVNALLLWFIANIIEGFTITSFIPALIGSVIISVVSWAGHRMLDA